MYFSTEIEISLQLIDLLRLAVSSFSEFDTGPLAPAIRQPPQRACARSSFGEHFARSWLLASSLAGAEPVANPLPVGLMYSMLIIKRV